MRRAARSEIVSRLRVVLAPDDLEWDDANSEHATGRVAPATTTLSFDEERRIRAAAQAAGMTVSAFLRQAGVTAASARVVDFDRLRRDVDEARARIDDAWQALA